MLGIVTMADHSVNLERTRITVADIIVSRYSPGKRCRANHPEGEHGNHTHANIKQPVQTSLLTPGRGHVACLSVACRARDHTGHWGNDMLPCTGSGILTLRRV